MKRIVVLSAVALMGVGSLHATHAEARDGRNARAVVAGVVGGLVAGALVGAATSNAYAAPGHSYGYAPAYRTTRVVRSHSYTPAYAYEYDYIPRRTYRTTRIVRSYEYVQPVYGYGAAAYSGW